MSEQASAPGVPENVERKRALVAPVPRSLISSSSEEITLEGRRPEVLRLVGS